MICSLRRFQREAHDGLLHRCRHKCDPSPLPISRVRHLAGCEPPARESERYNSRRRTRLRGRGLDGCRAGWIAAIGLGDCDRLTAAQLKLFANIDELVAWRDREAINANVCIDVPIGLPDIAGLRRCDREARKQLGRRWMCVFEPPDRELFDLNCFAT